MQFKSRCQNYFIQTPVIRRFQCMYVCLLECYWTQGALEDFRDRKQLDQTYRANNNIQLFDVDKVQRLEIQNS